MQSGVYWGYVGLIEGLIARIKAEFGEPMTVIATGGLGALFARRDPMIEHVDRDLTMRGLLEIYADQPRPDRHRDRDAADDATTSSCSCRSAGPARSA